MKTIKLETEKNISNIYIGSSILDDLNNYLFDYDNVVIITDTNVDRIYRSQFPARIKRKIVIGTGEKIKTLETIEGIYKQFLEFEVDRSYFIVGIGGGIVCDITGFAASTYMRGLKFGFVSTTLLSQVDASVGGKNGVNFHGFKNMIGTFNQPEFVLCDIAMLKSLSKREFINGLGEVIKHGLISDAEYFTFLESNFKEILLRRAENDEVIEEIIFKSIKIKSEIVKRDEREIGERKILNFGHTFGHAIEKNEPGLYSHGEAVSSGIVIALKFSLEKDYISNNEFERVVKLLNNFNLPTKIDFDKYKLLLDLILKDKKRIGETIDFIFLKSIGIAEIEKVSFEELREIEI